MLTGLSRVVSTRYVSCTTSDGRYRLLFSSHWSLRLFWADLTTAIVCWLGCLPTWFVVFSRFRTRQHGSYTGYGVPSTLQTRSLASTGFAFVPERILFKIAVTTYRALKCGSAPAYLSSYFTHVTDVPSQQRLRSASSSQLRIQSFNLSTVGKRAFPVSGANFWNSLPSHVTCAPSLAIFRQRIKTFLFHLSYPDLILWLSSYLNVDLAIILLFRPH